MPLMQFLRINKRVTYLPQLHRADLSAKLKAAVKEMPQAAVRVAVPAAIPEVLRGAPPAAVQEILQEIKELTKLADKVDL